MRPFQFKSRLESRQLMDYREIAVRYSDILREYASWTFGIPRSKLPYGIPEIEQALVEIALTSLDELPFFQSLRLQFASLAYFIDDEEALAYRKVQTAPESDRFGWLGNLPSDDQAQAYRIPSSAPESERNRATFWAMIRKKEEITEEFKRRGDFFDRTMEMKKAKIET